MGGLGKGATNGSNVFKLIYLNDAKNKPTVLKTSRQEKFSTQRKKKTSVQGELKDIQKSKGE